MEKFEKGDTVERTELGKEVTLGKVYEVCAIDGDNIQIINDNGNPEYFQRHSFKLVKKDKPRFKKGDSVRCIDVDNIDGHLTKGKIYEVEYCYNPEFIYVKGDHGKVSCYSHKRFILTGVFNSYIGDLFEGKAYVSELEMLVQRANLGQHAKSLLATKYPGQTEYYNMNDNKKVGDVKNPTSFRIRVKQVKEFEVCGYKCKIDGDYVHIGCRKYYTKTLKSALGILIREENSSYRGAGGLLFQALRTGICEHNEKISWEGAQKLLEEIS